MIIIRRSLIKTRRYSVQCTRTCTLYGIFQIFWNKNNIYLGNI